MNGHQAIDQPTKARLFEALSDGVQERMRANEDIVDEEHAAAEVGDGSQHSIDDLSQSDEEGELSGLHAAFAEDLRETLAAIKAFDRSPLAAVVPGAVISVDGERYVVGAAIAPFDFEGHSYAGIATDAPLYDMIKTRVAGDTFEFRGRMRVIDWVI